MKEKANLLRKSFISTLTAFVINTFLIFVLLFWGLMNYTIHHLNTNIGFHTNLAFKWFILFALVAMFTLKIIVVIFNLNLFIKNWKDEKNFVLYLLILLGSFAIIVISLVCIIIVIKDENINIKKEKNKTNDKIIVNNKENDGK
ncbi:hypothetical protein LQ356_02855 [Metamycoplasma faucium]|uniref:Uncharacterized protein n=1 Tax=Metamycoplasma faucium TaxID=56142 RepID=A0ABZ2TKY4_9BACT